MSMGAYLPLTVLSVASLSHLFSALYWRGEIASLTNVVTSDLDLLYDFHERIGNAIGTHAMFFIVHILSIILVLFSYPGESIWDWDISAPIATSILITGLATFLLGGDIAAKINFIQSQFNVLYNKSIEYVERVYYDNNRTKRLKAFEKCTVFPVDQLEEYLKRKASKFTEKDDRECAARKWIKKEILRLKEYEARRLEYSHNLELFQ